MRHQASLDRLTCFLGGGGFHPIVHIPPSPNPLGMHTPAGRHLRTLPAIIAALAVTGAAHAQEKQPKEAGRAFSFVVLPIPISSPAAGNGLAVAAVALYRVEGAERPWATGLGALKTDTSSWALAAGQKAYLADDRFRLTAAAAVGEFHIDYYGIGQGSGDRDRSIPITEKGQGGVVSGLWRTAPNLYLGLEYRLIDLRTSLDLSQLPFPDLAIPQIELRSRSSLLGLAGEYDTRDNEYQPQRGVYATGKWMWAHRRLGGDFNYTRVEFGGNAYLPAGKSGVFAVRSAVCSASQRAPFYDICSFGSGADLRGYVAGRYLDRALYAVQAEYRRPLFWRLGGVAFAGVGGVAPSFGKLSLDNALPAAGVGLRFQASKKYKVNAGIDYARGKDSGAVYFRIGEAF
ncbi:BamA/TamA family outer membrane protein [Caulobacter sp.]|uniref:BamA/TamA family outer membrane protein n=1 Tax=Caulobacter sp. TaxID=78 RepID=UPI003BAF712F